MIKSVYRGKFLKIYSQDIVLPNKNRMKVEYVKHPGAVCVAPFLNEDRIILIRQFRPVIRRYIWELAAGTLNKDETIRESAQRELIEEIGYKAKTLKEIGWVYTTPGFTTEKIHIFIAEDLAKVKTEHEKDEVITSRVFTRAEIRRLFKKNLIVDAKTICALRLCKII
ncbi:MAG: NUDIX hydrolase [Candidatus Omnitrophica bacterium]|nr:NUDIX hydrolase [Candidatus Omnitrophota bacterium]